MTGVSSFRRVRSGLVRPGGQLHPAKIGFIPKYTGHYCAEPRMTKRNRIIQISSLSPDGMALFPFILVRRPNPGPVLLNHERIHLRQQAELGVLPFYLWYITEYLIRRLQHRDHYTAYRNISFEREAFANEANLTYLTNRRFWTFRWYL